MSVTYPTVEFEGTGASKKVLSEVTPITWDWVNPAIYVETPEITTLSSSNKACTGSICTETWFELSQIKVVVW